MQACALTFLEYAGRRTITAVGHNFQSIVPVAEDAPALGDFVGYEAIRGYLGVGDAPRVDLEVGFELGNESSARLKIVSRNRTEFVLLDFNFHYAIGKAEKHQDVEQAIRYFSESFALAEQLAERFPVAIAAGQPT